MKELWAWRVEALRACLSLEWKAEDERMWMMEYTPKELVEMLESAREQLGRVRAEKRDGEVILAKRTEQVRVAHEALQKAIARIREEVPVELERLEARVKMLEKGLAEVELAEKVEKVTYRSVKAGVLRALATKPELLERVIDAARELDRGIEPRVIWEKYGELWK